MSTFVIVGAKFRPPARALLATLPGGTTLVARREPQNPHDANAIAVLVRTSDFSVTLAMHDELCKYGSCGDDMESQDEWHLGYIGREHAARLAPGMDGLDEKELEGSLTFSATGMPSIALF